MKSSKTFRPLKSHVRRLRREGTGAERLLWRKLRDRQLGAKFRRQVQIGPYICDFASHDAGLVVEVDGGQHADRREYDDARNRYLQERGYHVVRFWNNEVLDNIDGVVQAIVQAVGRRHHPLIPNPSPARGEGLSRRADEPLSPTREREGPAGVSPWEGEGAGS